MKGGRAMADGSLMQRAADGIARIMNARTV